MIELLETLTIPVFAAVVLAAAKPYTGWIAKRYALKRVAGESRYFVGAKVKRLYDPSGGAVILEGATITSLEFGRVELKTEDGLVLPMTVQEFEALHTVMDVL